MVALQAPALRVLRTVWWVGPWLTPPALRCPILFTAPRRALPLPGVFSGDAGALFDPLQLFAQLFVLS